MSSEIYSLVQQLADKLLARQWHLATAESCTGGGVSYFLTEIAGSSQWFDRGFITYSNEAKQEQLNVPQETIEQFGAVSEETAKAMAVGALKNSHAQLSVAVTGIAGPDGGTEEKPVGLVWFAWATQNKVFAENIIFIGDRHTIRLQAIRFALNGLLFLC